MGRVLTAQAMAITAPNFKDSVAKDDPRRKSAYMAVWQAMASHYGAYGADEKF